MAEQLQRFRALGGMEEAGKGRYVRYDDYDQLRQRLDGLLEMVRYRYPDASCIGDGWDRLVSDMYAGKRRAEQAEAKLALAEQDARRWRDRWVDYRTAHWRATQPYKQARFLAESEAIDIENKLQEARDLRAAIDASGEST